MQRADRAGHAAAGERSAATLTYVCIALGRFAVGISGVAPQGALEEGRKLRRGVASPVRARAFLRGGFGASGARRLYQRALPSRDPSASVPSP